MANRITECTNQAINQGDAHYEVDTAKCDECKGKPEQACKGVCPSECIVNA
jgi:Fe-S-cluster-containing hydrogenase component 2